MAPSLSRAFGLTFAFDSPIPGATADSAGDPDVRVHPGYPPSWWHATDAEGQAVWSAGGDPDHEADAVAVRSIADGAFLLVAYGDGMRFLLSRSGDEVWSWGPHGTTPETVATYLFGPVFGLVLRLRGTTCLHASVLEVEGGTVAVAGPAGIGKSTIAAAWALRGHRVLSDDIAPLVSRRGVWMVEPAVPTVRLWDDSVKLLFDDATALPLMAPGWEKRQLDLRSFDDRFAAGGAIRLTGVYVLGHGTDPLAQPQRLAPRDALMALVPNTYANVLLDRTMRAAEFKTLTAVVSAVPVWRANAPEGRGGLTDFCDVLSRSGLVSGVPNPRP
jgi:hypothetical protein